MDGNESSKRKRSTRSSRFFATPPPKRAPAVPSSINSATSSKYFVDSASSAIASFRAMPDFFRALVPPEIEESIQETLTNEDESCACEHLAAAARKQFEHCTIFQKSQCSVEKRESSTEIDGNSRYNGQCCDRETLALVQSLTHICSHACYLRAFAPLREWHALRTSVAELSEQSPDNVLHGWRCVLDQPTANSLTQKCIRLDERGPLVQTSFISPVGRRFKGRQRVLREVGIMESTDDRPCLSCESLIHHLDATKCPVQSTLAIDKSRAQRSSASAFRSSRTSPFGLLEELFRDDPWRLLLSTIMLNRTTRAQVDALLYEFLCHWPNAKSASKANEDEVASVVSPLGLTHRRARGIIRFSKEWLELLARNEQDERFQTSKEKPFAFRLTRKDVLSLHHCGDYAYDAYRIFIQGSLDAVTTDHALQTYVDFYRGLEKVR